MTSDAMLHSPKVMNANGARVDDHPAWPERAAIMALVGAAAGLTVYGLSEAKSQLASGHGGRDILESLGVGVASAAALFLLTVERYRWQWAVAFAGIAGMIIALIAHSTLALNANSYGPPFPMFSIILAVLIAAPLFQTQRDVLPSALAAKPLQWVWPSDRAHRHAWNDAVIGAGGMIFTGVTFLLMWMVAGLFDLIGIDVIKRLFDHEWFGMPLAGGAFGAATALLREQDRIVATIQRLLMIVLRVLAPVLAIALVLFVLSLPFTGLGPLWSSNVPTTPTMLAASAFALLLLNAVIGNDDSEAATHPMLRWAAVGLALTILPLSVIAFASMMARVNQYGLTPERIWGLIAVAVAVAYGAVTLWSVIRARQSFAPMLRRWQTYLAMAVCVLAVLLATSIIDFGAMSTRSQMARLNSGKVSVQKFDWQALAYRFGPSGRRALEQLARSSEPTRAEIARTVLSKKENEYVNPASLVPVADMRKTIIAVPQTLSLPDDLVRHLTQQSLCQRTCVVHALGDDQWFVISNLGPMDDNTHLKGSASASVLQRNAQWDGNGMGAYREVRYLSGSVLGVDYGPDAIAKAKALKVDVRPVTVSRLHINGRAIDADNDLR